MAERGREARKAFVEAALPAGGTFGPAPDAADLALINERYALAPLAAEELYVRRMVLANDALDRSYDRKSSPIVSQGEGRRYSSQARRGPSRSKGRALSTFRPRMPLSSSIRRNWPRKVRRQKTSSN